MTIISTLFAIGYLLYANFIPNVSADAPSLISALNSSQPIWAGGLNFDQELKPVILSGGVKNLLSQKQFIINQSKDQLVAKFKANKKLSLAQLKDTLTSNLKIAPRTKVLEDRVLAQTGGSGVVNFEAPKGRYILQVSSLPGLDITVPSSVNITGDSFVIPVALRPGDGRVKKVASSNFSVINQVSAAEKVEGNSQIKIATFYDKNSNNKVDDGENVVPWAGLRVDLIDLAKQKSLPLSPGWNAFSSGQDGLTASKLIDDLKSKGCPEVGVSTIDNGVRKTYLGRGENNYSSEDFSLEPGKVYSIKGCEVPFYSLNLGEKK